MNVFEKAMLEMKDVNEKAFKHLMNIPLRIWRKSRFMTNTLCDTLVNNMLEAFNFIFVIARAKLIVTMIEEIIVYLMLRWESNKKKMPNMKVIFYQISRER